jgi:hypothetical protein
MQRFIPMGLMMVALATAAHAQDSTVKSQTKIKADEGQVMTLTGCLRRDPAAGVFTLFGTAVAGDEVTTDTKTSTDVDRNGKTVTTKTKTKGDGGATSSFVVIGRNDVDLAASVGHEVQLSAVMVEHGHGDADVKIKEKTKTDPEHGHDSTSRSTTKLEVPRGPLGQYTVIALRSLSDTCTAR